MSCVLDNLQSVRVSPQHSPLTHEIPPHGSRWFVKVRPIRKSGFSKTPVMLCNSSSESYVFTVFVADRPDRFTVPRADTIVSNGHEPAQGFVACAQRNNDSSLGGTGCFLQINANRLHSCANPSNRHTPSLVAETSDPETRSITVLVNRIRPGSARSATSLLMSIALPLTSEPRISHSPV